VCPCLCLRLCLNLESVSKSLFMPASMPAPVTGGEKLFVLHNVIDISCQTAESNLHLAPDLGVH